MRIRANVLFLSLAALVPVGPKFLHAEEPRSLLLVFDLASADDGREGKRVGAILRARARRSGEFATIEDIEFFDAVEKVKLEPNLKTDPDEIRVFARRFRASYVIWGGITKDDDAYLISARIMKLTPGVAPEVIECSESGEGRQNVPRSCEAILRAIQRPQVVLSNEEELKAIKQAWRKGPNLCSNPGFEDGEKFPDRWRVLRSDCVPHVSWGESPGRKGRCLQYDMPKAVAASQGIMTFSAPIGIEVGATYRLHGEVLTDRPTLISFTKGHAFVKGTEGEGFSWREVWRRKKTIEVEKGKWQPFTIDMHPGVDVIRKGEPMPIAHRLKFIRIGLYAYWPAGKVYWDNVVFKKVLPASDEFRRKVANQAARDGESVPEPPEE